MQVRRIVGLAMVILVYVGGLIGWTWAVLTVDPSPSSSDSTGDRIEPSHAIHADARPHSQDSTGSLKMPGRST